MLEKMSEELTDFSTVDVLFMERVVQTKADSPGTDRKGGYDGNPIMLLQMPNDGSLPAWTPSLSDRRDQEESRLIDECDMGTQPDSVFFIRGHCFRFHSSMACSSRWRARFSGF